MFATALGPHSEMGRTDFCAVGTPVRERETFCGENLNDDGAVGDGGWDLLRLVFSLSRFSLCLSTLHSNALNVCEWG